MSVYLSINQSINQSIVNTCNFDDQSKRLPINTQIWIIFKFLGNVINLNQTMPRNCVQTHDEDLRYWLKPLTFCSCNHKQYALYSVEGHPHYTTIFYSYPSTNRGRKGRGRGEYILKNFEKLDITIKCFLMLYANFYNILGGSKWFFK